MKSGTTTVASFGQLFRAIGGTALALASPVAIAAIVDSGDVNLIVPASIDGIYLNVVTGASGSSGGSVPGWDFNPYLTGGFVTFFSSAGSGTGSVATGTTANALAAGDVVGPGSTFHTGTTNTAGTAFRTTTITYVGFKFLNESTGLTNYGFAEVATTAPGGFPFTIRRYVYENTGVAITVSPSTGLFRAYLDATGNDANPCTLPAPCRLLPAALAAVKAGGEIWMLDSANYNTSPATVSKSVTILAVPGVVGSLVASGGPALIVNNAGASVTLRNLMIVPLTGSGGTNGISVTAGSKLTLENCLVANLPGTGINVNAPTSVWITDSAIRNNGGDGMLLQNGSRTTVTRTRISGNANTGIFVLGTAGTTTVADIADSTVDGNSFGVYAKSTTASTPVRVSVSESQVVRNSGDGLTAESSSSLVTLSANNNVVSNNGTGIRGFLAAARVWASGNTVTNNGLGFHNDSGALFESAGGNAVDNNTTPSAGVITPIARR